MLSKALTEVDKIIKTKYENRAMLNHFKSWDCDTPVLATRMLLSKYFHYGKDFTITYAKYTTMLFLMSNSSKCSSTSPFDQDVSAGFASMVKTYNIKVPQTQESFCKDEDLRRFISGNKITLHACNEFRSELEVQDFCLPFTTEHPPVHDALQRIWREEYYGMASLYDIVHYVYHGDYSYLLTRRQVPFRILFTEYFNAKGLYSLLASLTRLGIKNYEVEVVIPYEEIIQNMKATIEFCGLRVTGLTFLKMTLNDYLHLQQSKGENLFDYIEYNGGVHQNGYRAHLKGFHSLLNPNGVIGISAFSTNVIFDTINRILSSQDYTAHIPFSSEPSRFIEHYLALIGYAGAEKDLSLVKFLSSRSPAFMQVELEQDLDDAGLRVVAWVPQATSFPYDTLPDFAIQEYKSFGLSESHFVENILMKFRHSVYVSRAEILKTLGPAVINLENLRLVSPVVIDRSEFLSSYFTNSNAIDMGQRGMSLEFVYSIGLSSTNISFLCLPQILPALTLLSAKPTVQELFDFNHKILTRYPHYNAEDSQTLLVDFIKFLSDLNYISLWSSVSLEDSSSARQSQSTQPLHTSKKTRSISEIDGTLSGKTNTGGALNKGGLSIASDSISIDQYSIDPSRDHKSSPHQDFKRGEAAKQDKEKSRNIGGLSFTKKENNQDAIKISSSAEKSSPKQDASTQDVNNLFDALKGKLSDRMGGEF